MKNYFSKTQTIIGLGILLNLIIAFGILLYKQPFNVDGIVYLNAANAFIKNGIKAAIAVYPWPFYSVLISSLSYLTHLPLEISALILNGIFTAILVSSFILLVKELGGDLNEQYFALLIILIYPYLNHDRSNILRDFGYYAFLLNSLIFFLRYLKKPNLLIGLTWNLTAIIAALFRIEGVILLTLVSLAIFFNKEWPLKQKISNYLKLNILNIGIIIVIALFLLINKKQPHIQLGRLEELHIYLQRGVEILTAAYGEKITLLQKYILPIFSKEVAISFLVGGLISIFLNVFLTTIGFVNLIFLIDALRQKWLPNNYKNHVGLYAYIIVTSLILFIFLGYQFFLSSRYIAPLCLLLLLFVPFSLSKLFTRQNMLEKNTGRKHWLFPITCILLLINVISSFGFFGVSKTYIIESGHWLQKNIPVNSLIYTNDAQLFYYSHRSGMHYPADFANTSDWLESLKKAKIKHYSYVALKISRDEKDKRAAAITFLKSQPVYQLSNKRGDEVLVFEMK